MAKSKGFPESGAKDVNPANSGGKHNEKREGSVGNEGYTSGGGPKSDGLALNAMQGIKQHQSVGSPTSGNGDKRDGLAKLLEPEKNNDEFGKGTVAKPSELDEIREDGNQSDLGDTTLLYGGGYFEREEADLEDGISLRETIDPNSTEPNYNYDIDPLTGSAPERKIGRRNNYVVEGKRGNRFEIGEM
jgi:hypothetical protein